MSLYTKIIDVQKLMKAWERVRKNKPACGIDHVTWEMYEENIKENVRQLNIELNNHEYTTLPVKKVTIYKGEKAREIALYAMRDKNVQQAVATELTRIFDGKFSDCTYDYRPNKSALTALENVEQSIKSGEMQWFLKADISHFFDTLNVGMLKRKLLREIKEEDVVDLIVRDCTTPALADNGELLAKEKGIYQGYAIAPILSNIYMMEFDREMEADCPFYLRYSDDILILSQEKEKLDKILTVINLWME